MKRILIILIAVCCFSVTIEAKPSIRPINKGWRFRQGSSEIWHDAQVRATYISTLCAIES